MELKAKKLTVALAAAGLMGLAGHAAAGSIFLTGHDNDFHQSANARAQMLGALAMVKNGSSLPVLTFDAGSELTSLLTSIGQAWVNVNPTAANLAGAAGAALFDNTKYSAFVVASITTCGGCDNPVGTGLILATQELAIINFFNAGGGIIGLAGASDASAYAYVPESATNAGGSPPSTGYVQTADGLALGIPAVNGDTTHNFFSAPGSAGLSAAYKVTERLGSATTGTPESVAIHNGTIICPPGSIDPLACRISVPEPGSLALMGLALAGMGGLRRRFTHAT